MKRLLLLVPAAVALTACGSGDDQARAGAGSDGTHFVTVSTDTMAWEAEVARDLAITRVDDAGPCGSSVVELDGADLASLHVEAVPTACTEAGGADPGNGDHGTYRSIDDVAEPLDVETRDTALGEATVFTQDYYECGGECETFAEPIAIITLDDPVDPAHPTLVLRAEKDSFTRAELEDLLDSLRTPAT